MQANIEFGLKIRIINLDFKKKLIMKRDTFKKNPGEAFHSQDYPVPYKR